MHGKSHIRLQHILDQIHLDESSGMLKSVSTHSEPTIQQLSANFYSFPSLKYVDWTPFPNGQKKCGMTDFQTQKGFEPFEVDIAS